MDLHRRSQFSAVVLEDKRMSHVMAFLAGCMVGGLIGVFVMCAMVAAGQADEREEAWFDEDRADRC